MWIERKSENLLAEYRNQFPVIIVTGARQVGKTSLLLRLFPDITYITLDDPSEAARARNTPRDFLDTLVKPAIIDEVQYAPELLRYLKIAVDSVKKNGQFFLTGSQVFPLMHNVSESLSGRLGIINLTTLSAAEISGKTKKFVVESYIAQGGFPAIYSKAEISAKSFYPSYIATYLERDVRNVLHVSSLRDYNRFLRAAAVRNGQILSLTSLARDVGISPNTVKSWLGILQGSGLIYLLEPYYRNIGKRLVKSPKVYFTDTGLLIHLLGMTTWREVIQSPLAGNIWETYTFTQIYKYFLNSGHISTPLWYWRTKDGEEVDFVVEKGNRYLVMESKFKEVPDKSDLKGINHFKKYFGPDAVLKSILLCKTNRPFTLDEGILVDNAVNPAAWLAVE
jgi:predicted AAA+ superfamily ATPase